ncbi:hypothetical protein LCGC14_3071390 [marine sediment metagenome]|uniref:Uncharacterized protein n=1 Tax=marine sediment metagenome TaxID=412755 RepID=A0A0F8WGL9_9ZZZZ
MEYLEGKLKCGCYAKTTFNPANYVLELCPLHKAALEMYEALQVALDFFTQYDIQQKVISGISLQLNEALAEGK